MDERQPTPVRLCLQDLLLATTYFAVAAASLGSIFRSPALSGYGRPGLPVAVATALLLTGVSAGVITIVGGVKAGLWAGVVMVVYGLIVFVSSPVF